MDLQERYQERGVEIARLKEELGNARMEREIQKARAEMYRLWMARAVATFRKCMWGEAYDEVLQLLEQAEER